MANWKFIFHNWSPVYRSWIVILCFFYLTYQRHPKFLVSVSFLMKTSGFTMVYRPLCRPSLLGRSPPFQKPPGRSAAATPKSVASPEGLGLGIGVAQTTRAIFHNDKVWCIIALFFHMNSVCVCKENVILYALWIQVLSEEVGFDGKEVDQWIFSSAWGRGLDLWGQPMVSTASIITSTIIKIEYRPCGHHCHHQSPAVISPSYQHHRQWDWNRVAALRTRKSLRPTGQLFHNWHHCVIYHGRLPKNNNLLGWQICKAGCLSQAKVSIRQARSEAANR